VRGICRTRRRRADGRKYEDGRGGGDNGSATTTAEGSIPRQGGMQWCSYHSCSPCNAGGPAIPGGPRASRVRSICSATGAKVVKLLAGL